MIYLQKLNFLYLRVPKTASTSLSYVLQDAFNAPANGICTPVEYGIFKYRHINVHVTISDLIRRSHLNPKVIPFLDIYVVVRDPIDRYKSWCAHVHHFNNFNKYETVEELINNGYDDVTYHFYPQTKWLEYEGKLANNIFAYENIDKMLNQIKEKYSVNIKEMPRYQGKYRMGRDFKVKNEIIERLRFDYKRDFEIYDLYKKV